VGAVKLPVDLAQPPLPSAPWCTLHSCVCNPLPPTASSQVTRVEGLGGVTSLVSLRLGGNALSSLGWLEAFHSPRHRLQHLDVSGNQVCCSDAHLPYGSPFLCTYTR
jgi:hypothetical protein